jgi:hypothetical protein
LQDQFGDPTKASGRIIFELYAYRGFDPERRGERVANPWIGYLETLDEQRDRWNRTSRTYFFQLESPQIIPTRSYVLTAEFQLASGGRFFDQIVLEAKKSQEETSGANALPPTTLPSGAPDAERAQHAPRRAELLNLEPVPTLLRRARAELAAEFDFARPMRVSRAPGRLDVMGGIADYTGSLVCEATLDRAAAVLLQERLHDREVQVVSLNLLDDHVPFTLRISLDRLAQANAESLQREFREPGRHWAAYLVGCLFLLHEQKLIDLRDPKLKGLNLALYSTVPLGAGVSSSAAIEVAAMINLVDHFGIRAQLDPMRLSAMCQQVENRICGAPVRHHGPGLELRRR